MAVHTQHAMPLPTSEPKSCKVNCELWVLSGVGSLLNYRFVTMKSSFLNFGSVLCLCKSEKTMVHYGFASTPLTI